MKDKRRTAIARLDREFSRYIRLRDADARGWFTCISCGRVKRVEQMDCGHYVNRRHMALRYSEQNCHGQCRECNRFDEGNMPGFRRGLVQRLGEPSVLLLESRREERRDWSLFELEALLHHYRHRVEELRRQKPGLGI